MTRTASIARWYSRKLAGVLFLLLYSLILSAGPAAAHGIHASYSTITVRPRQLELIVTFNLADMDAHFHINTDADPAISSEELHAALPTLYAFIEQHVTVAVNGSPIALHREHATLTEDVVHQTFVNLSFTAPVSVPPAKVSMAFDFTPFEIFGPNYTNLAKVVAGDQIYQGVISVQNLRQQFVLSQPTSLRTQLGQFIVLGITHIFLGYDHIMFLLALILIGGRLWNLIKIVTAFTIAHSITLILATLQLVTLPPRLIESGIALSIVYVAAENFFATDVRHRWKLTFCFGFVHGFGFANVLRELGLPTQGLISSLLAFNVGVELGQMAIVALLFPLALWLACQPFRRPVTIALSSVILLFGLGWFLERAFHLSFMPL